MKIYFVPEELRKECTDGVGTFMDDAKPLGKTLGSNRNRIHHHSDLNVVDELVLVLTKQGIPNGQCDESTDERCNDGLGLRKLSVIHA